MYNRDMPTVQGHTASQVTRQAAGRAQIHYIVLLLVADIAIEARLEIYKSIDR